MDCEREIIFPIGDKGIYDVKYNFLKQYVKKYTKNYFENKYNQDNTLESFRDNLILRLTLVNNNQKIDVIKFPVRGRFCKHRDCLDLEDILIRFRMNVFTCYLCSNDLIEGNSPCLIFDEKMKTVLKFLEYKIGKEKMIKN